MRYRSRRWADCLPILSFYRDLCKLEHTRPDLGVFWTVYRDRYGGLDFAI